MIASGSIEHHCEYVEQYHLERTVKDQEDVETFPASGKVQAFVFIEYFIVRCRVIAHRIAGKTMHRLNTKARTFYCPPSYQVKRASLSSELRSSAIFV
jgi:hypothetical protein